MSRNFRLPVRIGLASLCAMTGLVAVSPASAQTGAIRGEMAPDSGQVRPATYANSATTYADLVDLSLPAQVVARVQVRKAIALKPAQAGDVPGGKVRLYIEARTSALLIGPVLGESVRFLADVPLDASGKVPRLGKSSAIVLARLVPNRPGELVLVAADAMLPWTAPLETRLRAILTELVNPDVPPRITALREALHVPGNLAGEGETQLFFSTEGGKPVSLSVIRRPGSATTWGVSFTEIVDQAARPPMPETLAWYRLACALPPSLPVSANISDTARNRRIAAEDYGRVISDLGPCTRNRPVR